MSGLKVLVRDFLRSRACPFCSADLPVLLVRGHRDMSWRAFSGWASSAEKRLGDLGIHRENRLRRCGCGYAELNYPIFHPPQEEIYVEVGS